MIDVKINHFGTDPGIFRMSDEGYCVSGSHEAGVVAFYLDAWTKTSRAYPISTCSSIYCVETDETKNFPSIHIEDGSEDTHGFAEIYFPEFEGWKVHSVDGGKTMSICLVNR